MFIGVETDDTERTLDMKRIGPIAARLVANPTELVAAANFKRSTELGKGADAEAPAQLCPEKGDETRDFTGSAKQPGGTAGSSYGTHMRPALTVVRCGPTHPPIERRRSPRASRVGPHLAIVGGTHHARSLG